MRWLQNFLGIFQNTRLALAEESPSGESEQPSEDPAARLLGKWVKIDPAPCDQQYPDTLEFKQGGIYLTPSPMPTFKLWQSGDYLLQGDMQIEIQVANDAMLLYSFSLSDEGLLTFRDEQGCEVKYVRGV